MITPFYDIKMPEVFSLTDSSMSKYEAESWEDIRKDPRGLALCWEAPIPHATYIMGLDPSEGITGWTRASRVDGDTKTDNGVVEIFRIDGDFELLFKVVNGERIPDKDPRTGRQRRRYKDVQVAEFAAPCDAVEIARVANLMGRIYSGAAEDQCELIWEAWPGPGLLTTQELLRLGYGNLWMWEYIDSAAEETNRMGWRSTRESQRALWSRSRRHLMLGQAVIRSHFLLEEYSNAEVDVQKMRARAAYGFHDDRIQAANMCYWAGHKWTYEIERTDEEVRVGSQEPQDYQRYAPGLPTHDDPEGYKSWADWRAERLAELED